MSTTSGSNYSLLNIGAFTNLKEVEFNNEKLGTIKGKNFLKETLGLSGMEVSLNVFPANTTMPFHHKHELNEELYIFIKGKGQFQVDDETFEVSEGSMVKVTPQGVRIWRNTSDEDLYYFVVQARANSMQTGDISDGSPVTKDIEWPEKILAQPI